MNSPTATLLREAADRLESHARDERILGEHCAICDAGINPSIFGVKPQSHTPDCLITRLRVEAEKLSATGSGEG